MNAFVSYNEQFQIELKFRFCEALHTILYNLRKPKFRDIYEFSKVKSFSFLHPKYRNAIKDPYQKFYLKHSIITPKIALNSAF